MPTYQDIKNDLSAINKKSRKLAMMSREDIFDLLADITFVNDKIADYIRDIDKAIDSTTSQVVDANPTMSAAAIRNMVKAATSSLESDKSWASRQSSNLKDIRISALAAQRDL